VVFARKSLARTTFCYHTQLMELGGGLLESSDRLSVCWFQTPHFSSHLNETCYTWRLDVYDRQLCPFFNILVYPYKEDLKELNIIVKAGLTTCDKAEEVVYIYLLQSALFFCFRVP